MKLLNINYSDYAGGSAIACSRLHNAFLKNNEDLLELVGELRELVVNKDFENKAFNDVLIDKLYFTVFDSRDIVRKEKNKWK